MMERILKTGFFSRPTSRVAKDLLGMKLIRQLGEVVMACRIVEVEAYLPRNDDACHAAKKKTARNAVMFDEPGRIYVYSIHGKCCFNLVTEERGLGCAVLVRAAIPLVGQEFMRNNRPVKKDEELLNGPAKLCQSIEIDKSLNGLCLGRDSGLWIVDDGFVVIDNEIISTPRIGVTSAQEKKLRFVLKGSRFASGPKYLR